MIAEDTYAIKHDYAYVQKEIISYPFLSLNSVVEFLSMATGTESGFSIILLAALGILNPDVHNHKLSPAQPAVKRLVRFN